MRKLFILLFLVISTVVFAQQEKTVVFDFSQPETLTPSIQTVDEAGYTVVCDSSKMVFTNGPISMYFIKVSYLDNTPNIKVDTEENNYERYLQISNNNEMFIKGDSTHFLKTFYYDNESLTGNLELISGYPGTYSSIYYKGWDCGDSTTVTEVGLLDKMNPATKIKKIYVTYTSAQDVFKVLGSSITDGAKINSFKELELTFESDIENYDQTKEVSITSEDGTTQKMNVAISGSVATLSVADSLIWNGTDANYTINIPAGTFVNEDENYNNALTYNFTLVKSADNLKFVSALPATGVVAEIPNVITLTMSEKVGHVDENVQCEIRDKDNVKRGYATLAKVAGTNMVTLTLANDNVIKDNGIYTIKVPAMSIFDMNYSSMETLVEDECTYNPEIKLVYNVGDIQFPSDEILAAAQDLLDNTGVGYPSENSSVRTALQNLVESQNGSDATFTAAMDAFKAEADEIELPETGKSYTIANVTKDGKKYYVAYNDGQVSLSTSAKDAYKFKATANDDKTISFETADTLYLHVFTTTDTYTGTSRKQVSKYDAKVNNLVVARFDSTSVSGLTKDDVFGKLTIYGCVGTKNNKEYNAYSLVSNGEFDLDVDEVRYFDNTLSSAFVISEVEPTAPEVTAVVTPNNEEVAMLESMTITFNGNGVTAVDLADASKITLKNSEGEDISFTVTKSDDLTYYVNFASLAHGKYTLNVEEGAFTHEFNGKTINVAAFASTVTVLQGDDFVYDFNDNTIYHTQMHTGITAENMNYIKFHAGFNVYYRNKSNITRIITVADEPDTTSIDSDVLYIDTDTLDHVEPIDIEVDELKDIRLETIDGRSVLFTGNFERELRDDVFTGYLTVNWTDSIASSSLADGYYQLVIPEATIGDENFGAYLANPTSVDKTSCHVNANYEMPVKIDHTASAIRDVYTKENALRRNGKFIENGKIVIYKNGQRYNLSGMILK